MEGGLDRIQNLDLKKFFEEVNLWNISESAKQ